MNLKPHLSISKKSNSAYSSKAAATKEMAPKIQASMAVTPSARGMEAVTPLLMLMRTSRRVTRRAIRPGTTWGGMRKLIQLGIKRISAVAV